jgi:DNA-binding CsgD family transcriptional regulator
MITLPVPLAPLPIPRISAAEVRLLQCLALGMSDSQIKHALAMNTNSAVSNRVGRLARRVGAVNRIQLVVWAVQWGVIET